MGNYTFNCRRISIGGYKAVVDPNGTIIKTDPEIEKLRFQNIKEVYERYRSRTSFKELGKVVYPLIVSDDRYNRMIKHNKSVSYLAEKFDCVLL